MVEEESEGELLDLKGKNNGSIVKKCTFGEWMVGFDGDWGLIQKSNSRVVVGYSNQKINFQNMEEEIFNYKDKLKDIYF